MARARHLPRAPTGEVYVYVFLSLALCATYLVAGFVLPAFGRAGTRLARTLFGFSQLRHLGIPGTLTALALVLAGAMLARRLPAVPPRCLRVARSGRVTTMLRLGLFVVAVAAFYTLRNRYLNPDGVALAPNFASDVPRIGAHVTHDEMWELYLHSRAWFYANRYLGWTVEQTYHALSSLGGGVFAVLLSAYSTRLSPGRPLVAFLLCVAGGYMQLFFGDVENYTLTAAWVMGYLLTSVLFLEGRVSLVVPSALLAVAMTFHLLAGFFGPSLAFLFRVAWGRGERRSPVLAAAVFGSIIGLTLLFFHFNGLPLRSVWYHSHALGEGGDILKKLAPLSISYYIEIANLSFLLVPAWILLVPLLAYRRIALDPVNIHLMFGSGFMALFVLGWGAGLGVYRDWNLFAIAGVPISLLVWRNVLGVRSLTERFSPIGVLGFMFFLHSYAWIVSNHFR